MRVVGKGFEDNVITKMVLIPCVADLFKHSDVKCSRNQVVMLTGIYGLLIVCILEAALQQELMKRKAEDHH